MVLFWRIKYSTFTRRRTKKIVFERDKTFFRSICGAVTSRTFLKRYICRKPVKKGKTLLRLPLPAASPRLCM